jgi:hypothetical protein
LGEIDNLFLGNLLQGHMQHIANRAKAKHIYLLDDGTDTLRVHALRNGPESDPAICELSLLRRAKNLVRKALIDWDVRRIDSVTFFTSYELIVRPEDRFVRNSYAYWRKRQKNVPRREVVYFVGQPLVEDGYLTPAAYLDALARIIAHYRGRQLLYLTHRREAKANVAAIRAMGIAVTNFELPIEVEMLLGSMPRELSSFFSSALDNSRIMFGGNLKVTAFRINRGRFNPGHEFVDAIYDYLGAHSGPDFNVVDLYQTTASA